MKQHWAKGITLLGFCSHCSDEFREGTARFMLGAFPMEQFCSFRCAEKFLEGNPEEQRFTPLPPSIIGKDPLLNLG